VTSSGGAAGLGMRDAPPPIRGPWGSSRAVVFVLDAEARRMGLAVGDGPIDWQPIHRIQLKALAAGATGVRTVEIVAPKGLTPEELGDLFEGRLLGLVQE